MSGMILVVDDDSDMCAELERVLGSRGFEAVCETRADVAFSRLINEDFDCVVTDLNMKGMSGIDLCDRVVQNRRDIPVIVVTGFGSMETAVATLRAGAFDFLTKPFNAEQLMISIERALRQRRLTKEVERLRRREGTTLTANIIGESLPMREVAEIVHRIAETDTTVLICGESGTGKELVARAIHEKSARAAGPMIAINCAALPENLLESELFGHVKGAFTDAKSARRGLFAEASGGTLFLDEVGEMPLAMQAKLLRALEDRRVRPVGGSVEIPFDARVIAATNRDLQALVEEKAFREDLYYRLDVVRIDVPPLRSRGTDVLLLAQAFLERFAKRHEKAVTSLSAAAADKLVAYAWPGNVRELSNSIERAVALGQFSELVVEDLPPKIRDYKPTHIFLDTEDPAELMTLEALEKRYIERVMNAVG